MNASNTAIRSLYLAILLVSAAVVWPVGGVGIGAAGNTDTGAGNATESAGNTAATATPTATVTETVSPTPTPAEPGEKESAASTTTPTPNGATSTATSTTDDTEVSTTSELSVSGVRVVERSGDDSDGIVADDAAFAAVVDTDGAARVVVSKDGRYKPNVDLTAVGGTPVFDLSSVEDGAGVWTVYAAANDTAPPEPENGSALDDWASGTAQLLVANTSRVRNEAADAAWASGDRRWRGSELFVKSDTVAADAGDVWVLYRIENDGLVRLGGVALDENAEAVIDTERLTGQFVLVSDAGSVVVFDEEGRATRRLNTFDEAAIRDAALAVSGQDLSVTVENTTVATRPTTLVFDSNRGHYPVTVSAERLSDATLADALDDDRRVERTDEGVRFRVRHDENRVALDRTPIGRGQYELDFSVPDSDAEASATILRFGEEDVSAAFGGEGYKTAAGSVVRIPIRLQNADRATVHVGSRERNYRASVQVVDDGDGVAVLEMNTWLAGRAAESEPEAFAVTGGRLGGATLHSGPIASPPLDPASYPLNVTVNGNEKDAAMTGIGSAPVETPTVRTAPGTDYGALKRPADVRGAAANGTLTAGGSVAHGDTAVVRLQAPGLVGALDARTVDGTNRTAAFVDLAGESGPFEVRIERAESGPNSEPGVIDLSATRAADGLRVVSAPENGTVYLMLRTDRTVIGTDGEERRLRPGDLLRANLTVHSPAVPERRSAAAEWRIVERQVRLDRANDGAVLSRSVECQHISGLTSLAPGSSVEFRVRGTDPAVLRTTTAVVGPDGRADASLNLSGVPANATLDVTSPDATVVGGTIRVRDRPAAAVELSNQTVRGGAAAVRAVRLPFPGFVVLYDAESFQPIGVSDRLGSGTDENVPVSLTAAVNGSRTVVAIPHADADGDGQFDGPSVDHPYRRSCEVVTDAAVLTESDSSPKNGSTATRSPERTATTSATPTTDSPTDAPETDGAVRTAAEQVAHTDTGVGIDVGGQQLYAVIGALAAVAGGLVLAGRSH